MGKKEFDEEDFLEEEEDESEDEEPETLEEELEKKAKKTIKKKKPTETYVIKEIPVQYDTAIGKSDAEEVFTEKGVLLEILNKLDKIEKAIA